MTNIQTFTYNGQDVEVIYHRGEIKYVFEVGDKRYGNAVKVGGKKTPHDIVAASFALIINFLETKHATEK